MRIGPKIQSADAKEISRQGELAFTMIEIALAVGVIGFALVAIIGILPAGLNVQKDNREDTLISQDAPYFLDAIRNGVVITNISGNNVITYNTTPSLDFLANYVQSIKFVYVVNGSASFTDVFLNTSGTNLTGAEIIGLLSTPQTNYNSPYFSSNYFDTIATVRALSGPATEQQNGPQNGPQTGISSVMAFTYQMEVMITPFNSFAPSTTNASLAPDGNQVIIASTRRLEATPGLSLPYSPYLAPGSGALQYNLFEVRLRFSWPVLQNGSVGPGRQTYRTLIASPMVQATANPPTDWSGWFFQPQVFANGLPNGPL